MELPHAAQTTPSLEANSGCPTLAGQFQPPGWLTFPASASLPSVPSAGGASEEHTWLNTGCNLGALQAGNSEAACSNRHWELDVLTQDPNDLALPSQRLQHPRLPRTSTAPQFCSQYSPAFFPKPKTRKALRVLPLFEWPELLKPLLLTREEHSAFALEFSRI
uniref:Uncharacterized protein n=1 Tax=Cyanistes caeruleus TaxID=156563 RepID=A0A8C0VIQ0_CYACU